MSQLAPELIPLRTLLEVTVKSFTVSQAGLRKRSGCVLCVCNLPVPKTHGYTPNCDVTHLTNTCGVWTDFNSFLSGDLTAAPPLDPTTDTSAYI